MAGFRQKLKRRGYVQHGLKAQTGKPCYFYWAQVRNTTSNAKPAPSSCPWASFPNRRVPKPVSRGRFPLLRLGNNEKYPYTRNPAQSAAITAVTDGLLPRLGIDSFHAS